jgi:hypothetical protein
VALRVKFVPEQPVPPVIDQVDIEVSVLVIVPPSSTEPIPVVGDARSRAFGYHEGSTTLVLEEPVGAVTVYKIEVQVPIEVVITPGRTPPYVVIIKRRRRHIHEAATIVPQHTVGPIVGDIQIQVAVVVIIPPSNTETRISDPQDGCCRICE